MKETLNVNVGSVAFTMDVDAYDVLRSYLDDVRTRLTDETYDDVERRIAEIFRERVTSPMMVITLAIVQDTMARVGRPSDFGEPLDDATKQTCAEPKPRRLYRSRKNRSIGGVCGGLAEYLDVDDSLFRLVTLLLMIFGGLSIWIYIILWLIIPEEPIKE